MRYLETQKRTAILGARRGCLGSGAMGYGRLIDNQSALEPIHELNSLPDQVSKVLAQAEALEVDCAGLEMKPECAPLVRQSYPKVPEQGDQRV